MGDLNHCIAEMHEQTYKEMICAQIFKRSINQWSVWSVYDINAEVDQPVLCIRMKAKKVNGAETV